MTNLELMTREECTLVVNNLKLVEAVATWLQKKEKYSNHDDLVSAGHEGLIWSAKTFNESRGKFTSYAWKCITNAMRDDIRKFHTLTEVEHEEDEYLLPLIVDDETEAWKRVDQILENAGLTKREWYVICHRFGIGYEPRTTNQLAEELRLSPQMVNVNKREALRKMRLAA